MHQMLVEGENLAAYNASMRYTYRTMQGTSTEIDTDNFDAGDSEIHMLAMRIARETAPGIPFDECVRLLKEGPQIQRDPDSMFPPMIVMHAQHAYGWGTPTATE